MIGTDGSNGREKFFAAWRDRTRKCLTGIGKIWHCRWPTLCCKLPWGASAMLDRKTTEEEVFSRSSAAPSQPDPAAGQNVIVLHDLTSGPEAEVGRLKSRMVELNAEIGSLRNENQSLKAEMREMKLVLTLT